jgi:glycosyltransferase involved in cell wall biosynthesis
MEKSHIMLIPSLWYEPFGITVLEAMAYAMPAVTSGRGGLNEIVTENGVGVISNLNPKSFADKIEFLVNNKSKYEKISENCIKNIGNFKPKIIFKKYKMIFNRVQ